MNETAFVEKREPDWQRLTYLCDRAEATLGALDADQFRELVSLYRRASTDLATVRTRSTNVQLAEFLNDMVGRAYGILYRTPRGSLLGALAQGVWMAADTLRRRMVFVLTSAGLFFGSAFFAYGLVTLRPDAKEHLVPAGWENVAREWRTPFEARTAEESAGMTGFYLSNNPRASIGAASIAAVTFGVGTAYSLFFNGALLGALAKDLEPHGQTGRFLTWISPHGVPELSGIIVAGGAGFVMGWALIAPGRRKRGEALAAAGRDAIVLLTTSVVLMFIAAPIEGFFSFNPNVPDAFKLLFAAVAAAGWVAFIVGYGREVST